MKVRMTVGLSGPAYNLQPGDEFSFPDGEAARLIAAGYAVPVVETPIERAVEVPGGFAFEKRGKGKKGKAKP